MRENPPMPAILPKGLAPYNQTPEFSEETVPAALLKDHNTKAGVWGLIHVKSGTLEYTIPSRGETMTLTPGTPGVVEPQVMHHIAPKGPVRFFVEFWR